MEVKIDTIEVKRVLVDLTMKEAHFLKHLLDCEKPDNPSGCAWHSDAIKALREGLLAKLRKLEIPMVKVA